MHGFLLKTGEFVEHLPDGTTPFDIATHIPPARVDDRVIMFRYSYTAQTIKALSYTVVRAGKTRTDLEPHFGTGLERVYTDKTVLFPIDTDPEIVKLYGKRLAADRCAAEIKGLENTIASAQANIERLRNHPTQLEWKGKFY